MNEQALKERLKYIAKTENCTFGEVWKRLLLERFLSRISRSIYHDKFIFKGGLLLSYYIALGRETMDIDFPADKINAEQDIILRALTEVSQIKMEDGFTFIVDRIEGLEHQHMDYSGFRVSMRVSFYTLKDVIKIDIAVGDKVEPREELLFFSKYKKVPLFEGAVSLKVYPVESIFSEKLETIISRGIANSRMKDYHDVLLLCRASDIFNMIKLKQNIDETFDNRGTSRNFPIKFDDGDYVKLQKLWKAHKHSLSSEITELLPGNMQDVVSEINCFLEVLIEDHP